MQILPQQRAVGAEDVRDDVVDGGGDAGHSSVVSDRFLEGALELVAVFGAERRGIQSKEEPIQGHGSGHLGRGSQL